MQLARTLAGVALFKNLSEEQRKALAKVATVAHYGRNATIFSEGDPGDRFPVVLAGQVRIFKMGADGKEQTLHFFGPGEPFGEVAVFTGIPYPAHAVAIRPAEVAFIRREDLAGLIAQDPDFGMSLLGVLSRRLVRFTQMIEDLSLREVPARLAAFLLLRAKRDSAPDVAELELSKAQLAGLLGTSPESLSRALQRLSAEGIIVSLSNRRIQVLDRALLESLATGEAKLGRG